MYAAVDSVERARDATNRIDAELARQALDNGSAFAELYQRYRVRVYQYLRARTTDEEDAADLTQQTFLAAFNRLAQYRDHKGSFATWLFTIARNAATDFQRRRRPTVDWESLPTLLHPTDDRDLATDLVRREDIARLGRLMTRLPLDKRELLALRYGADLTIPEIAAIIGKSTHATYKQFSRLLQSLEDSYDDPLH